MTRSTRFIVVAIAAAAIAPAAQAATGSDDSLPVEYPAAGIIVTPLPAPFPLPVDPIDIPGTPLPERSPAATAPQTKQKAPSAAKQKGFWGMKARARRPVSLISDNAPSQNRITLRNVRMLAAKHAKQDSVRLITENSAGQNRVASRKAAATRELASTLRTSPE